MENLSNRQIEELQSTRESSRFQVGSQLGKFLIAKLGGDGFKANVAETDKLGDDIYEAADDLPFKVVGENIQGYPVSMSEDEYDQIREQ